MCLVASKLILVIQMSFTLMSKKKVCSFRPKLRLGDTSRLAGYLEYHLIK